VQSLKVDRHGFGSDQSSNGLFGEKAIVTAVHAGLETAVIGEKVPGLDMLSFGPQIEFPHSPDERVSVPTVERFWKLLVGVVDEMSRPEGAA